MSHAAILFCLLLPASGPGEDLALLDEVKVAIREAAAQTFYGTIECRKEMLIPPRPELLEGVSHYDPDNAPVTPDEEVNAGLREHYGQIREGMRYRATNPHASVCDLAVTIGPEEAIRLDRYYRNGPARTTVWRAGRIWEYSKESGILLTCEADRGDDGTPLAWTLHQAVSEARYMARRFVNQVIDPGIAEAVESARVVGEDTVVARLTDEQGVREMEFVRVDGRLRLRSIRRHNDERVVQVSFARYVHVGESWISQWVESVEHPASDYAPEDVHRCTQTITSISVLDESELEALFARPDPYDPAYPKLMYEQDVTEPGGPMFPLREGLPVLETMGD